MTVLALETTVHAGSLSLFGKKGEIAGRVLTEPTGKAGELLQALEHLLDETGRGKGDLDEILVSTGYGSYTGSRVGWALALGLSDALGIKALGVPLLPALSLAAGGKGRVLVCISNGRRFVCRQEFSLSKNLGPEVLGDPAVSGIEELTVVLADFPGKIVLEEGLLVKYADSWSGLVDAEKIVSAGDNLAVWIGRAGKLGLASDNEKPIYLQNPV